MSVTPDALAPDTVVTAWREMSALHAAACAALERELGERHGLGVSDFEVLDRLVEAAETPRALHTTDPGTPIPAGPGSG